jgi:ribosomal protein S6--L-glutamate ligase
MPPVIVGWEEWLALPDLGLPAIRAKIDTGAKTSALHAFAIEPFGPAAAPMVRFGIHPIPGRDDITRFCTAAIADRREVTSSNGEKEIRFVIRTRLVLGERNWGEIETTLTNREGMAYRMLLGRQAIRGGGMLIDPSASFLQPKLSHQLYRDLPAQSLPVRHLRIALIATKPTRTSNILLREEAQRRGHALDILALDPLDLDYARQNASVTFDGATLPTFDAIIARATGGPPGKAAAIVRLMQQQGAVALNGGDALDRLRSPYAVSAALHAYRLPAKMPAKSGFEQRCLVVQGTTVASVGGASLKEKKFAGRVATALGLGLVTIDVAKDGDTFAISNIDPNPSFTGFGSSSSIASDVITALETRIRTPGRVHDNSDIAS